jgi:transcriptional regulator with XRE-family HTH domain
MKAAGKIANYRKSLGVSQQLVAKALGRNQVWVSAIERGAILPDRNTATLLRETICRLGERERLIRAALAKIPGPETLCEDLRVQL